MKTTYHQFEGWVDTTLGRACNLEATALAELDAARKEEEHWAQVYANARGVDSAGCRWALANLELIRIRRRSAGDMLRDASRLLGDAIEIEREGLRDWGLPLPGVRHE